MIKEGGCFHFLDRLTLVGVANGWVYCLKGSFVSCNFGEVTPSLINAYMCAHDLFIGGLFTLQKRL